MGADLLAWYDAHARVMPWRVGPADRAAGVSPDPYRVWLSEVMLQQTTVAAVRAYFRRFTERWPTVADLAAAADGEVMAEWAGLGYYARARNLLACARAVADGHGGVGNVAGGWWEKEYDVVCVLRSVRVAPLCCRRNGGERCLRRNDLRAHREGCLCGVKSV